MDFSFIEPRLELKPYIRQMWIFNSPLGMPASHTNIAVPTGSPKLIINIENAIASVVEGHLQQSKEQSAYFIGNRDIPVSVQTSRRKTSFIGIEFYPHGAYPFLGIPMSETANTLWPVDILLSAGERDFNEILFNIRDIHQQVAFIQQRLVDMLQKRQLGNPLMNYCVQALKASNGLMTISALEQKTGYSRRYLEMLFKNHVGFSPKLIGNIFRFQKFHAQWARGSSYEELKNELYTYYYDQSHFIKEFKQMTGFAPQHYLSHVTNEFGRQLSLH